MALFHIISHVIKKKKRVLLSSFTIFDLINIVKSAGGEPVFIDQKKNSFELDEYLVKKECDKNDVGAIILTHYSLNSNNLEIIRKICKDKNIALIQDLAISPFSRFKQKSLIEYSDYSFFSFGTFKFVSIFFGGALISKKNDIRETIKKKELNWAYYSFKDYYFQFIKSILIKILTSNFIFKLFTFPIFKYAEKFQFKFILNFSKNDPNPINYSSIINDHKKRLPEYNIKVLESLIPYALKDIKVRKRNYEFLFNNIKCKSLILFNPFNFDHEHSYINFPILVKKNKKSFIRYIFENNLDLAYYYYKM